ncbi:MAG: T9SS C-terminal target domain-containing protein [Cytophagales bacterium]|nr:MAG: T9SS C-terminal target domain-containing protein [Cytophagales bacterium]
MAWEHIIKIANRSNKHLWINVPINAEPNYMEGLAKLLKQTLKPGLKVYFEISNEVWNFGFPQFQFNAAAAEDEVAKNPSSNLKKAGETKDANGRDWQVRRLMRMTIDMVKAFQKEYGNDCVNKSIFPQFAFWTWVEKDQYEKAFQWCNDTYGPPSQWLHGMSISGYAEDQGRVSSTVDQLIALQKPFIDRRYTQDFEGHKATADKWKIKLTVYEGSTNFSETANIKNKISAVRDPKFEEVVKYLVQDTWFNKLKGAEFCFFALAGNHSSYGTWGIAETDFNKTRWESSPKWKALTKMVDRTFCTVNGTGPNSVFESTEDMDNIISLYPSPSAGLVNLAVRTYSSETVDVKINDISGKTVRVFNRLNVSNGVQLLNLTDLENGVYFVNISDAGRTISDKLVIAK